MKKLFNNGWQFSKNSLENWQDITLPHDWLIYDVNNLYETSGGYYRRFFNVADYMSKGQRLFLYFDGVYMDATVYVNGTIIGQWKYGYTAFWFDITDCLKQGQNEIMVKVDFKAPNSRWYSGAGICRDVYIEAKDCCYFVPDGVCITPGRTQEDAWDVIITAEVMGGVSDITHTITNAKGNIIAASNSGAVKRVSLSQNIPSPLKGADVYECAVTVNCPQLWDINSPNLYYIKSELNGPGGKDEVVSRFGFRTIEYTPNDGFYLNGRRIKHNGVCLHHDAGALGAIANEHAIRRQLLKLREMGVNAIRTSHNPPASIFMKLADEMGFLVLSEFVDMWRLHKTEYDYARFFDEWAEKDVASWIRRDRNCPSVIMWSIGNEIRDTHEDAEEGARVMRLLMSLVKKHDPRTHAPVTLCSNYMPWENTQKCADIIKLIGYNYAEYLYAEHHEAHPDWLIYGSETGSTVQSRGVYHFPYEQPLLNDDDMQCSALGNSTTSWGAKSVEAFLTDDRDAPFSFGQYIWTGTDYIGEPTPYQTKNSYFGHIDTAGFLKDSFYIIQSAWTDYKTNPMAHIFPYWDFSEGQEVDVRCCTNAPYIELFADGKSLGKREIDHNHGKKITADYKAVFTKNGTGLCAKAYDENGNIVAVAERLPFADTAALKTKQERFGDLVFCEIAAADKNGNPVENANDRVWVTVNGGELLGLDNGDSTDYEQYKTDNRRMFNGKLLAIARVRDESAFGIDVRLDKSDVCVRKIELVTDNTTPRDIIRINAKLIPEHAVNREINWRLTDAKGVDSPLGELSVSKDGLTATVIKKGDGRVYVRCSVTNGKPHADFYTIARFDFEK